MKRKLLSLLVLLIAVATGAMAQVKYSATLADGSPAGWSISPAKAVEGAQVTISYTGSVHVNTVTFTYAAGAKTLTTTNTSANEWTFNMPSESVVVTVNVTASQESAVDLADGVDLSSSDLKDYTGKQCYVSYKRNFTNDKTSTVCLPFAYTKGSEGTFYAFAGITTENGEYVATMEEAIEPKLGANTPYLFSPATPAPGEVTFTGTIANVPDYASYTECTTTSGDWTFVGTFATVTWTDDTPAGTYGFSAEETGDIKFGQFVKAGSYVRVKPMRCYLKYKNATEDFTGARGANRAAEQLPETIKVRLISANGEVDGIGTLQTNTGEVTLDNEAWYTLDGRRIEGQPSAKGIYVRSTSGSFQGKNNVKKVIIK